MIIHLFITIYHQHPIHRWDSSATGLSAFDAIFDCAGEAEVVERAKTEGLVKEGGVFVTVAAYQAGFDPTAHQPKFSFGGEQN